jgi:hypothetical protein
MRTVPSGPRQWPPYTPRRTLKIPRNASTPPPIH